MLLLNCNQRYEHGECPGMPVKTFARRFVDQLKLRGQAVESTLLVSILVVSALIINPILSQLELENLHLVRSEISMSSPAYAHLKCKKDT